MSAQREKEAAAEYAANLARDGMIVGLGTGTTAALVVRALGRRVADGLRITGVPTSDATGSLARSLHIPLATLDEHTALDMVLDGADEVDPRLNLIKGRGGALLREKLVALAGRQFVVVVDESKLVPKLDNRAPIPVEVVRFGWVATKGRLEALGLAAELRGGDNPYVTDGGNVILDCQGGPSLSLADPALARAIKLQPGVVEHGLFLEMATAVVVGRADGSTQVLCAAGD